MAIMRTRLLKTFAALTGALALFLTAACGSGGDEDDDTVTLGINPSWTDGLSMAYLWKNVLERDGYEVEIEEIADAGLLFTGVANGDIDIFPAAAPEITHASYMEQYEGELEDLGAFYDRVELTFAVPEYTDIDSIADLKGDADRFGEQIIGIEAGSGLTEQTKNGAMPTYGLEDEYTLVESSTTAMLAALQEAIDNEEDIVVTLWRPFWANSVFPVKDLEDPEEALGGAQTMDSIATAGFSEEMPEVAEMFGNLSLDDEEWGSLENLVVNEYDEGDEEAAIEAWLEQHPDFVDSLKG